VFFDVLSTTNVMPGTQGLLMAFASSDRVQNTKRANSLPGLVFPDISYRTPTA
jgi:hypothetical protein